MTICPNCGHSFTARAELGQGTKRAADMKLNRNRINILKVMNEFVKAVTIKQIQTKLFEKNIYRDKRTLSGPGWNYHTVQADASILLSGGYIRMTNNPEEFFDSSYGHQTDQAPRYIITEKGQSVIR